ncbi:hypothetical protein [Ancylobacter sp.]|uniref:hypothetical protein n=1 Tax=Ancylobacter sp. TaxID=1872567 RepID=UPI003C7A45F6
MASSNVKETEGRVNRAAKQEGRGDFGQAQSGDESERFPMPASCRSPLGNRQHRRAMLVDAQVLSMKIKHPWSSSG